MKLHLILLLLLTLGNFLEANAQRVAGRDDVFTEPRVGVSSDISTTPLPPTFHRLFWKVKGVVTSCSVRLEYSTDGVSWTNLSPDQDCTVSGQDSAVSPITNFIRFNVTTLTGGGPLAVAWSGFEGTSCGILYNGSFSTTAGADPTPGAELSITVPSTERWRIYAARFELQADNNPADREVFLTASSGGDTYFRVFADGVVKANQQGIFTSAALGFVGTTGLGPSSINQSTDVRTILIPIYSDAFIPGGHTLATATGGLQAGDDYSAPTLLVERCPN